MSAALYGLIHHALLIIRTYPILCYALFFSFIIFLIYVQKTLRI